MSNTCSDKQTFIAPADSQTLRASELIDPELTAVRVGVRPAPRGAAVPLAQPVYHTQPSSKSTSEITPCIIALMSYQAAV